MSHLMYMHIYMNESCLIPFCSPSQLYKTIPPILCPTQCTYKRKNRGKRRQRSAACKKVHG